MQNIEKVFLYYFYEHFVGIKWFYFRIDANNY